MSIVVDIALATLCIISGGGESQLEETQRCYPVLIGGDTPRGEFQIQQRLIESPGYGGDVLQFKEEGDFIYAIHRVWLGRPHEKRLERLKNPDPAARRITMGCINVDPMVYEELIDCCSTGTVTIK